VKTSCGVLLRILAVVALLFGLSPQQSVAEEFGSIRGRLIDVQTGMGIGGAQIHIVSHWANRYARTDPQGFFSFAGVDPGRYTVVAGPTPVPYHMACSVGLIDISQDETATLKLTWTKQLLLSSICVIHSKSISTVASYAVEDTGNPPGFLISEGP